MNSRKFSGQTIRRYDEHPEHSRRALFAKDREINDLQRRLAQALSTLDYITAVIDGQAGGNDPPWQVEQVATALTPAIRGAVMHRGEHAVVAS